MTGKKGANGGAGGKGGTISLRCAHFAIGAALGLNADGGDGGTGLPGQAGGVGGTGGQGHSGGTPCWMYDDVLGTDVAGQTQPVAGGNGGRGGFGGDGGDAGAGGTPGTIAVRLLEGTVSPHIDPMLRINAGGGPASAAAPGSPGDGGPHGDNPPDAGLVPDKGPQGGSGKPGKIWDRGASVPIDVTETCAAEALTESLTQPLTGFLLMLFERLRTDLLIAGTSKTALTDDELNQRIAWIGTLLNAYTPVDPAELPTLDGLQGQADTMAKRATSGLDYYGNGPSYAPLGSVDFHRDEFTNAQKLLTTAQADYNTLLDAFQKNTVSVQRLGDARQSLVDEKSKYDAAIDPTRNQVIDLLERIRDADEALKTQQTSLIEKDDGSLKAAINSSSGVNFEHLEDFLDCLDQFAFMGEHGPQGAALVIGQLGKLINTGVTKCIQDDGTKADKTYLIDKLTQVDDLSGALSGYDVKQGTISGIQLKDPGAVKLLGRQKDLDDFCQKLWNFKEAQKLKKDFDAYVAAVQARNADILNLNQTLSLLHGYLAGSQQAAAGASEKTDEMAVLSMPGAPTILSQLGRIVNNAKAECIHQLYLVSRAYWFWSLNPDDQLSQILSEVASGSELALTDTVLKDADTALYLNRQNEIEKLLSDPGGWLPALNGTPDAKGFIVSFDDTSNPRELDALRTENSAIFGSDVARSATSADDSVFAGWADVRLRKVRAWIFGTKTTDDMLQVEIEHLGSETIVSRADSAGLIQHDNITIPFRYDCRPGVGKPECLNSSRGVTADGDISLPGESTLMSGLIGPFAQWRITIKAKDNKGLDLKGVIRVDLEMFVHARLFERVVPPAGEMTVQPS